MKAVLEFDLPDEETIYQDCSNGVRWRIVATETDDQCRNWLKYGHEFKTPEQALEAVRDCLLSGAQAYNLSLHE